MTSTESQAQEQQVRVFGSVTYKDHAPASNVVIQVSKQCKCSQCDDPNKCKCCPGQFTVTTTEEGRFDFNVPSGKYYLRVGGQEIEVVLTPGEDKNVNFVIDRGSVT